MNNIFQLCESTPLYRFTSYRAGLTKHSLFVDNNGAAAFSYTEKGSRNPDKPTIVFVHGLSSNKETWIPIIKVSKHCIVTVSTVHDKNLSEINFSVFFFHIMRYKFDSNGDIDSMRGQLHDYHRTRLYLPI